MISWTPQSLKYMGVYGNEMSSSSFAIGAPPDSPLTSYKWTAQPCHLWQSFARDSFPTTWWQRRHLSPSANPFTKQSSPMTAQHLQLYLRQSCTKTLTQPLPTQKSPRPSCSSSLPREGLLCWQQPHHRWERSLQLALLGRALPALWHLGRQPPPPLPLAREEQWSPWATGKTACNNQRERWSALCTHLNRGKH